MEETTDKDDKNKSGAKGSRGKGRKTPQPISVPVSEDKGRDKGGGDDGGNARAENGGGGGGADALVGVGITLVWKRGQSPRIKRIRGPPASESDLQEGDELVSVDSHPVAGEQHYIVVGWLQGRAGEAVTLTVNRNGEPIKVELVRCVQPPPSNVGDLDPAAESGPAGAGADNSPTDSARGRRARASANPPPEPPPPTVATPLLPARILGFETPSFFTKKSPPPTPMIEGDFDDGPPPAPAGAADGTVEQCAPRHPLLPHPPCNPSPPYSTHSDRDFTPHPSIAPTPYSTMGGVWGIEGTKEGGGGGV